VPTPVIVGTFRNQHPTQGQRSGRHTPQYAALEDDDRLLMLVTLAVRHVQFAPGPAADHAITRFAGASRATMPSGACAPARAGARHKTEPGGRRWRT